MASKSGGIAYHPDAAARLGMRRTDTPPPEAAGETKTPPTEATETTAPGDDTSEGGISKPA